jgi:leucyl/phenylalanyl-tRNA--protein transferase
VPIHLLNDLLDFPPAEAANEHGVLAIGGDLRPERLLRAYCKGIFPWPHEELPLLWFSPDPRMVLRLEDLQVSRRLERTIRQGRFRVTLDRMFEQVIEGCATVERPGRPGTWITTEMIEAYTRLHHLGYAHSAEAWRENELVGGLYGISLGSIFIGESMFTRVPDASKVAFVTLVRQLRVWGDELFDAQTHSDLVERFGATEWPRPDYLRALRRCVTRPTRRGAWRLDPDLA